MASARAIEDSFVKFIRDQLSFDEFALQLFRYQATESEIFKTYLGLLKLDINDIDSVNNIPFLPIRFFKEHKVVCKDNKAQKIFLSSSTTGNIPSKHIISSLAHYQDNAKRLFEDRFGKLDNMIVMGLLPSYLERTDSSLVSMVDYFIGVTGDALSAFHLHNYDGLKNQLSKSKSTHKEVILFAVRYALLDLAEKYELDLSHVTIIETGGMKGKRGPVSNPELISIVQSKLKPKTLLSEYGMTELQSQAYSNQSFVFKMPQTMRVLISDLNDPFSLVKKGSRGQINIIDLANIHSCAFISTDDLGALVDEDHFTISGRIDHSEQRGCNLLVADVIS